MKSNTTTILVAVGALLVGGVATAAFLKGGDTSPTAQDGLVTAALFVISILTPDPFPFVEEILFGLGTLLLANWKKRKDVPEGNGQPPIDGEARRR